MGQNFLGRSEYQILKNCTNTTITWWRKQKPLRKWSDKNVRNLLVHVRLMIYDRLNCDFALFYYYHLINGLKYLFSFLIMAKVKRNGKAKQINLKFINFFIYLKFYENIAHPYIRSISKICSVTYFLIECELQKKINLANHFYWYLLYVISDICYWMSASRRKQLIIWK